jgi:hypothetical protein
MKKLTNVLLALTAGIGAVSAAPVALNVAQKVASNFYSQNTAKSVLTSTLAYTENDASGVPLYYIFNINDKDGWVIITGEDASRPVLGYSTNGNWVVPTKGNNIYFWMQYRKKQLDYIRTNKYTASSDVSAEWSRYINNTTDRNVKKAMVAMGPLCQSTWDQQYSPYPYNYFCPPNTKGSTATTQSVTGCVATAMSQIMRYWSYPAKGTGSHSYCDCTSNQNTENYGTLSANFAHTYSWSLMPLTPASTSKVSTADTDIARLMSDCGTSVEMDYSPSGSGAYVLSADIGGSNTGAGMAPCAQYSYVTYFGYYAKSIHGVNYPMKSEQAWIDTMENEFSHSRIIEYEGQASDGGHTWVCDGNDGTTPYNNVHMNWGWSGYDDGFFAVTNLTPDNSMPAFNTALAALIGITPPPGSLTSVEDIATPTGNVVMYPNPNNGNFTVELSNATEKQQLTMFNVLGQSVYTTTIGEGKTQISLNQPAGIYFYRVLSLTGSLVADGKVIVK